MVAGLPSPDGAWEQLVEHAQLLGERPPGKRWRARADVLLEAVPADVFRRELVEVVESLPYPAVAGLHGLLVLVASIDPGEALLAALGAAAERCFRRVPYGPRNQPAGTLCVKALAAHGGGAAQLEALLGRVVYPRIRERIALALDEIARGFGISRLELSELSVPEYGMDCHGARRIEVDGGAAELHITSGGGVDVVWEAPSGREQKTPPAALRRTAPEEVREVTALAKEIRRMVGAQRVRIERSLSEERSWGYAAWRVRYMEHPLVAPISKGLIWRVLSTDGPALALEWQGKLVDAEGQSVEARDDGHVSLWHPLESDARTVRAWRMFVEDRGFRQPLKQAHREAFRLGIEDGLDECGSTRFAGHVVRQDLFAALCRSQGWHYALQGCFHSAQEASIELPGFGLVATLEVPFVQPYDPSHMFDPFVSIGALSFASSRGGTLALRDVPARLFSETMRDVSLFVSVASVANTPDWQAAPTALRRYYRDATFPTLSEAGLIRRDFIERRRESFPQPDRLSLDDRALVVRGELHTYRIHLDTAQILIAPDGPLLSLPENVGPRTRPELDELLPFADGTLSLVLSAAALLARDADINDAFVRVQLAPRTSPDP